MKFKVGDKVRVKRIDTGYADTIGEWLLEKGVRVGDVFTVEELPDVINGCYYMVEYCPNLSSSKVQLYESEMEYACIKATDLAKFMYPEWEEKDGWLYPKNS